MTTRSTDYWRTPPAVLDRLATELGWWWALDLAASDESVSVAPRCITERRDLLSLPVDHEDVLDPVTDLPLAPRAGAWLNPPYSRDLVLAMALWWSRYVQQGVRSGMLVRFDPSTRWFRVAQQQATGIIIFSERLAFLCPVTGKPAKKANFVSCFIYHDPDQSKKEQTCRILSLSRPQR